MMRVAHSLPLLVSLILSGCTTLFTQGPPIIISPDHELAGEVLQLTRVLRNTEPVYEAMKDPKFVSSVILIQPYVNEDGSTEMVSMESVEKIEKFVIQIREQLDRKVKEIKQRGIPKLGRSYGTASACKDKWLLSGTHTAKVRQTEHLVFLEQEGNILEGVVVGSSIVFIGSDNNEMLAGSFTKGKSDLAKIRLQDINSKCFISLF